MTGAEPDDVRRRPRRQEERELGPDRPRHHQQQGVEAHRLRDLDQQWHHQGGGGVVGGELGDDAADDAYRGGDGPVGRVLEEVKRLREHVCQTARAEPVGYGEPGPEEEDNAPWELLAFVPVHELLPWLFLVWDYEE